MFTEAMISIKCINSLGILNGYGIIAVSKDYHIFIGDFAKQATYI